MKNKTSLLLMEQLVMILVFALCAALCLQCFVAADRISGETGLRDDAVLLAQNTAEALKSGTPIPDIPDGLTRTVEDLPDEIPGLRKAEIRVYSANTGDLLIRLTAGWQEVGQ